MSDSDTNRDLVTMVREGRFRDDLYYRVSVMTLELPPLRSYRDNLEVLAHVLLLQAARKHGRPVTRISHDALAVLHSYSFPGNVRELKNALEHAAIVASGDEVQCDTSCWHYHQHTLRAIAVGQQRRQTHGGFNGEPLEIVLESG